MQATAGSIRRLQSRRQAADTATSNDVHTMQDADGSLTCVLRADCLQLGTAQPSDFGAVARQAIAVSRWPYTPLHCYMTMLVAASSGVFHFLLGGACLTWMQQGYGQLSIDAALAAGHGDRSHG
jgi:hypothetical protein